jgi:hypothetical protein
MRKIYLASSWRNPWQPATVALLRGAGHEVYDFREAGFGWSQVDPAYRTWTVEQYVSALGHPRAVEGYERDMAALEGADTCIFLAPAGVSAALELGWAEGALLQTAVFFPTDLARTPMPIGEPELMFKMADRIFLSSKDLLKWLTGLDT